MSWQWQLLMIAFLVATAFCGISAAEERTYTLVEREIETLIAMWPGDYENREQLSLDATAGKADVASGAHLRIHSQVRRVDLPEFGEYVLYVEEYQDADPASIFRQRLYVFTADEQEKAVRLKMLAFRDAGAVQGAHDDLSLLADLTLADTLPATDDCDVLIRRDGDWLAGSTREKACSVAQDGKPHDYDYQVRISTDQVWFRERVVDRHTGEPVQQIAEFGWHQLERARWFACMIDFPGEPGGLPNVTHHYIRIHDQGGEFSFADVAGNPLFLSMRNTWSYGMQRESFVIAVQEGDTNGRTVVYSWGSPGSDRIGLNPGHLRVQCDLDTPTNVKMQHWLRPTS